MATLIDVFCEYAGMVAVQCQADARTQLQCMTDLAAMVGGKTDREDVAAALRLMRRYAGDDQMLAHAARNAGRVIKLMKAQHEARLAIDAMSVRNGEK